MLLAASTAILAPLFLLAILNMPALKGMTLSAIIVTLTAFFIWKMDFKAIIASILQATHKTIPILWILFGALLLLNLLTHTKAINRINHGFNAITSDMRIQTVMIAYLFGGLIEGVSGFGTPAMVTGPLLISLGFSPLASVTLALAGDSTAATFGAVGTPLTVGFSNTVSDLSHLAIIGKNMTITDFFAGSFVPLIIIFVLIFFFGKTKDAQKKFKDFIEIIPWALLIGFSYTTTAIITQITIGYEFVSIITPIVALLVIFLSTKLHIFVPKNVWQDALKENFTVIEPPKNLSLLRAWLPYLLVVVFLLITRVFTPVKAFATNFIDLSYKNILGFHNINSDWPFLYSPGTVLLIVSLLTVFILKSNFSYLKQATKQVTIKMIPTALALLVTLIMVQVFSNSALNTAHLGSMPNYIATNLAKLMAPIWPMVAPFLGEIGAFITGSATVSNLTFSPIQANVATVSQLNPNFVLALQALGAAAGNMICVHNIVAASAVVGLTGKEGAVLRKTIIPAVCYGCLVAISAFFIVPHLL